MTKICFSQIKEKSRELVSFSQNNIASEIEELRVLPEKFVWKGTAKDKYVSVYNQKINTLIGLNENIEKVAEFLLIVTDSYSDANSRINNAYEELLNDFKKVG